MSEAHTNGNGKLGHLVLNANRTLVTVLLGVTAWMLSQAYDELKGLRSQVATINENAARMDGRVSQNTYRLDAHERRLDRLETR